MRHQQQSSQSHGRQWQAESQSIEQGVININKKKKCCSISTISLSWWWILGASSVTRSLAAAFTISPPSSSSSSLSSIHHQSRRNHDRPKWARPNAGVDCSNYLNQRGRSLGPIRFLFYENKQHKIIRVMPHSWRLQATTTSKSTNEDSTSSSSFPFLDSDDPFCVLQIDPPTVDVQIIRKAYRRMAVRFHPDVTTNKDSTTVEKKLANDRFAKINWAYQTLSGKNGESSTSSSSPGSRQGSTSSSSSSAGWTPPHRRREAYTSSSSSSSSSYGPDRSGSGPSTDWRDYIPNYNKDQEDYSADGDSFTAIFADLFKAAGTGAMNGGGILRDFVEFLENEAGAATSNFAGVGGFSSSTSSVLDEELRILLQTGTVEQIGEEMDDAALVQEQLQTKFSNLQQDIVSLTADLKFASALQEKMTLQEDLASVQARIPIVQEYLKQAQKRLLALQTRYKELIVRGGNDPKAGGGGDGDGGGRTGSVWDEIRNQAKSSSSSYVDDGQTRRSSTTTDSTINQEETFSRRSSSSSSSSSDNKEDAWKSDSFGSFGRRGRGRSSSRKRGGGGGGSSRQASSSSSSTTSETTTNDPSTNRYSSSSSSYSSRSTPSVNENSSSPGAGRPSSSSQAPQQQQVPPHRRTYVSYEEVDYVNSRWTKSLTS